MNLVRLVGLVAFFAFLGGQAWAANCTPGTGCACGDRVNVSGTLTIADPIVTTVCPGDGLELRQNRTLNLGGFRLQGSGVGTGIFIETGSTNTVTRGIIDGFGTGIATRAIASNFKTSMK